MFFATFSDGSKLASDRLGALGPRRRKHEKYTEVMCPHGGGVGGMLALYNDGPMMMTHVF